VTSDTDPLSHLRDDLPTRLDGTSVLIFDGEKDRRRSTGDGVRLAERLTHGGAMVSHHLLPVGHSTTVMDGDIVGGDGEVGEQMSRSTRISRRAINLPRFGFSDIHHRVEVGYALSRVFTPLINCWRGPGGCRSSRPSRASITRRTIVPSWSANGGIAVTYPGLNDAVMIARSTRC